MKVAIYSRKSRFSEYGESIKNQIQMCTDYIKVNLNVDENNIEVFEDEGYSGKNTERPEFQKLLERLKNGEFNALVCYRLDRISRNVGDFSKILDLLQIHNVDFISINERFDTTTPIGRAMIHISSVFAQLERETIAERVRDNYYKLAKTGRWLGGNPPLGYKSKLVKTVDIDGNKKSLYQLTLDNSKASEVKLIFEKYIELQSLYKVEKFLTKENIRTQTGARYSKTSIRSILINPVFAVADTKLYDYLASTECFIANSREEFDGTHGAIGYSKTESNANGKRHRTEINKWIISIGKHKAIISSNDWIKAQMIISANKDKAPRTDTSSCALFTNTIICANCGSRMRLQGNRKYKDGSPNFYYTCDLKQKSENTLCNAPNIPGPLFDKIVLEHIKQAISDKDGILAAIRKTKADYKNDITNIDFRIKSLQTEVDKNNQMIDNLVNQLAYVDSKLPATHITAKITELSMKNDEINNQIKTLRQSEISENSKSDNIDILEEVYQNFDTTFDNASIDIKRNMLKSILKKLVWDNGNVKIEFYSDDTLSVNFSNNCGMYVYGN